MNIFIDTEFIEDGHTIELLSIGAVGELEKLPSFYRENSDVDLSRAGDWVKKNVILHLSRAPSILMSRAQIAEEFLFWVNTISDRTPPVFWGYYADYDWVVVCQMYGRMVDLPKGFPMFCMDLKQVAVMMGSPKLPQQDVADGYLPEHHALFDAQYNRELYRFLLGAVE